MSVRKSFDFILCIGGCHCEIILRCLSSATGNIGSKLGQDRNIRSLHSLTHPLTNPESKCGYASHRRQKPQKKESSFFFFVCIIGDWNFALILLRWRDAVLPHEVSIGRSEEYGKHISFDISADYWNAEVKITKQIIKQENRWTLVNGKNTNCNLSAVVLHVKPSYNITWALGSSPQ